MTTETPEAPEREISQLRYLHDTHVSLEKFRIGIGNRVSAMSRGVDGAERPVPDTYQRVFDLALSMEETIDEAIEQELKRWPVYDSWLRHVKGIGPSLAGQMLALLLPPIPTKGPSSWYKAAGLAPERRPDGQMRLPRARAGEGKITYHKWLRRTLWNVATSFVRTKGYYRDVYDSAKERLVSRHSGDSNWPPIRLDSVARWEMIKLFLSHLWDAWCEVDGIHNRGPYGLVELPDGTRAIREEHPDGSVTYHALIPRPLPDGKTKI